MKYLRFISLIIFSALLLSCSSGGGGGGDSSDTHDVTIVIDNRGGSASIIEEKNTLLAGLEDFMSILLPSEAVAGSIGPCEGALAIPGEIDLISFSINGVNVLDVTVGEDPADDVDHCSALIRTFTVQNGVNVFAAVASGGEEELYRGSTTQNIIGNDSVQIIMEASCSTYELTEIDDPSWNGSPDNADDGIDDGFIPHTMPWPFTFYGKIYNQIFVDYNGSVWFEFEGSAHSFDLATGGGHGPVISAWNNNLSTEDYGRVRVRNLTSPDRVVIGWYSVETYDCSDCDYGASFEVVLYPNGNIQFNYDHFDGYYVTGAVDYGSGISKGDGQNFESLTDMFGPVPELLYEMSPLRSFLFEACPVNDGCDLYADVIDGNDSADCRTANTACETITHALTLTDGNETICVADGFYDDEDGWETFPLQLKEGTKLLCQGEGHSSIINSFDNETVIIGAEGASVEGCAIQEGIPAITDDGFAMTIHDNIIESTCFGIDLSANSTVSNNVIQNMYSWECENVAVETRGDGALIDNNTIVNNGGDIVGIIVNSGNATVTNNVITGNRYGIRVNNDTNPLINNNTLSCNGSGDLYVDSSFEIDAQNNRWDNVSPTSQASCSDGIDICGGQGGGVNYSGATLAPNPCSATTVCVPTLISPAEGDVMDNACIQQGQFDPMIWEFDWSSCEGATEYHLNVRYRPFLNSAIDLEGIETSSFTYDAGGGWTEHEDNWFYRVRAMVNGIWGEWSEELDFTVEPLDTDCPVEPVCGDGNLDPGEECDDGNTSPGDGCDALCTVEPDPECYTDFDCPEEGMTCTDGICELIVVNECPASIVLHNPTGQLGGALNVDINGTLWDATFYNQWTLSPRQSYNSGTFAQDASLALYNLFHTSAFNLYDTNANNVWGCESLSCKMVTPVVGSTTGATMVVGYSFVNNVASDQAQVYTSGIVQDQDSTISFVQWSLSDCQ